MTTLVGTHHVALTVTDLDASLEWYRDVFGFQHMPDFDYDHPDGGGRGAVTIEPASNTFLVLHRHDANERETFAESRTGLDHVCFGVPDAATLEQWAQRLDARGVPRSEITQQGPVLILVLRDPDNIQLELAAPA